MGYPEQVCDDLSMGYLQFSKALSPLSLPNLLAVTLTL